MTIAFVVPRYGDGIVGGAETLSRGLAEHLAARGTPVEVLTTCARDHHTWRNAFPEGREVVNEVPVHRFPVRMRNERLFGRIQQRIDRGDPLPIEDQLAWVEESVSSPSLYAHLLRHREAYELVCFAPYLFGTTFWGSQLVPERAVLIPCLHDEPYARLPVIRTMFESCHGFIFNSPPEAELARRLYAIGDRPCGVVGYGFDPPPAPRPERFHRRHKLDGPFLLYVGRKEKGKNVPLLIEYFLAYRERFRPDLTLCLVGEGPIQAPRGSERAIRDLGYLGPEEKLDAYAAATVVCQPSVNESFSIIIMEAWLAGTPVLVHAGCPVTTYHLSRSGGGLAFEDYFEFAEALGLLLDDATLNGKLAAQGRAYVLEEYSWPAVMARFEGARERLRG